MPVKPGTHKPARTMAKRHEVIADYQSQTRKDFTNASGYGYKWRLASKAYLKANPLCAQCEKEGWVRMGVAVDHVQPHRGDMELFWDKSQWQTLCKFHHDSKTGKGF